MPDTSIDVLSSWYNIPYLFSFVGIFVSTATPDCIHVPIGKAGQFDKLPAMKLFLVLLIPTSEVF